MVNCQSISYKLFFYVAQSLVYELGTCFPFCGQWLPVACSLAAHHVFSGSSSRVHHGTA